MELQNEKVMLKNTQHLDNELNRPVHKWETFNTRKKLFVLQYSNIDKFEMFRVLNDRVAQLTRRSSEWGRRNHQQSFGPSIYKRLIKT